MYPTTPVGDDYILKIMQTLQLNPSKASHSEEPEESQCKHMTDEIGSLSSQ